MALSRERTPEEYREVLESSLEEYAQLSRMINEFLFIARTDDPHNAVTRLRLHVREELENVLEFMNVKAEELGITISCDGDACVSADPDLLRRAISNLVSNALAHTTEGGHISVVIEASGDENLVEVRVSDTGSGIAQKDLPHVLERFYQSENGNSRTHGGSGLGLAIVKSIMTLHGGSVELESTEGEGTTVTLRFPSARDCENCDRAETAGF